MRIGVDADGRAGIRGGTVGIADPGIDLAARGLRGQGDRHRTVSIEIRRMPAVEFAQRGRHQSGVGQAGGRIVLGMAGDRAGLRHRRLQAVLAQVGGAGAALARAEVDGDGDAAVAGGLDGFHLAHAHVDGKPAVLVAADLGLAGTGGAGLGQQLLGDTGEPLHALAAVVGDRGDFDGRAVQWTILY
jgi:hypothetical protein